MASRSRPARPPYVGYPSVRIRRSFSCCASRSSLVQRKPPIFAIPSFFCGHGTAIAVAEHFLCNLLGCFGFITVLAKFDEVGILGETARVEVKRNAMFAAHPADLANVFH